MANMQTNPKCTPLSLFPLWVIFFSVFVFCLFLPLCFYYCKWNSRYRRGKGDLHIANRWIAIPSISKTWRNLNAIIPVLVGAIVTVTVYSICLVELGNQICVWVGILLALFVFSFNDETPPISTVHSFFAFGLFGYLAWLVFALRIYFPDDYIWYWAYIPMGFCFLVMVGYTIENSMRSKQEQDQHWPSWVSACEHIYIYSFLINLLLIRKI